MNLHLGKKSEYKNPSYRRSDHPSFQQKRHTMVVDAQGASNKEIQTESGTLRFENGVAVLPDDSRARDMVQEMNATNALHPNQFALIEKKGTVNVDKTHRYHFGSYPAMPWATYDELGRRVKDPDIEENINNESVEQGTGSISPERGSGQLYPGPD